MTVLSTAKNLWGAAVGKTGKAIDVIGKATGNILPEFNISERAQALGAAWNPVKTVSAAGIPQSQVEGASNDFIGPAIPITNRTTSGGVGTSSNNQQNYNQGISNLQGQQSQGLDFIEQDYNNALGMLAGQEQGLRGQADIATGEITQGVGATGNELRSAQAGKEADVQNQVNVSEKGGQSAMQQARDLFRQTQQSNNAQLSALGISSSSVSEALAERLGVETARRIAGVTGSVQEVRDNAAKELTRTREYYQGKLTELDQWANTEKAKIQQALMSGLNQINGARNQAATDKSRDRATLINNVQSAISQLTQQQQQFQQSLDAWAKQKSAALTPLATDPTFMNSVNQTTNLLNAQPGISQANLVAAPEFSTDPYGRVQGQIKYGLNKKPQEDDLAAKYGISNTQ